ncbi:RDD family protein [Streptomyces sp. 8K308]|uniref:RDD family protein n=1 Tax=Streptomyces sp. 8K308 TaxID=2530388 RepID=UPI00104C1BAC|nr:RDD family protein [Streptomyces sp. 8K308]TDC20569.1 RDD family protein [Streptomyces sp. 8K308]
MTVAPREADGGWLGGAVATDALVALGVGLAVARLASPDADGFLFAISFFGCALATSFVNHVLGMWLLRGSVGKLLWGLRVVRAKDGGRPGFWRSTGRWLVGYVGFVLMVLLEDGDTIGEACGLRTVRWRDLRHYARYGYYPAA